jgi:putative membrane protein
MVTRMDTAPSIRVHFQAMRRSPLYRLVTAHRTYPAALLAAFVALFIVTGISPTFRQDWFLENLLVLVAIGALVATHKRFRFTDIAYTLIFVFLVLHEIGAHYTYSLVPYDEWVRNATGESLSRRLGFQRNHYDRLLHFAYGFLLMVPVCELIRRVCPSRGAWRYAIPVAFILSNSVMYEVIEWAAAEVFGGELGTAYVGTQGDEWDAQKDMALAAAGAILATALILTVHAVREARRTRAWRR